MRATGARTHVWNNGIKSAVLMALFPVFLMLVAYAVLLVEAGFSGYPVAEGFAAAARRLPEVLPWAIAGAAVWFVIAFFFNVRIVGLATGAKSVTRKEEPLLYNLLENLCISRGMTMPKLRIMETSALNAYAAGMTRRQYTVAVTRGLLDSLNPDEIEAVLAHELAHIKHGDVRLMVVASVFVGIVSLIAEAAFRNSDIMFRAMAGGGSSRRSRNKGGGAGALIVLLLAALAILLLARLLSAVTQMALSRTREYMADMEAVLATRNPDAMVSALLKVSKGPPMEAMPDSARGMLFDNQTALAGLFSTHPPMQSRIDALVKYGRASLPEQEKTGPWG